MRIRFLGGVAIRVGSEWRPLRGHAAALLAVLNAAPASGISLDRLIEEMWGDSATSTARGSVQRYVAELRRQLGMDAIVTTAGGYRISVSHDEVDTRIFEMTIAQGQEALSRRRTTEARSVLEQGLRLWATPWPDLEPSELLEMESRRLDEIRFRAEDGLLDSLLALDEHGQVVERAQRLTEEAPLDEAWWAHLMMGLYRGGRQAEALRVYRQLEERLGEELGIVPSRRMRRLEEQILLHDPDLDIVTGLRSALPADSTRFIGRRQERSQLLELLGRTRLITIAGPGGVGKSRIAVETARQLFDVEAVLFASLRDVLVPEEVPAWVAHSIGVPSRPGATETESLVRVLEGRSALLLMDNCEHVRGEASRLVSALLASLPELKVLVTSQIPLRAMGETVWRLGPMQVVAQRDQELPEGMELFIDAAWRAQPSLEFNESNLDSAARICQQVDGLPLAIELAAAWCALLSPEEIVSRLEGLLASSQGPQAGTPEHHVTLTALVGWSAQLLAPEAAAMAQRGAIFQDGFDLEAAGAVFGLGSEQVLNTLVTHSLIYVERSEPIRYRTLRPIQQALLGLPFPDLAETRERHAEHYCQLAIELGPLIWFDRVAVGRLTAEHANISAALAHSFEQDRLDRASRMCRALLFHWMFQGYLGEGRRWYDQLLNRQPSLGDPRLARALHGAGVLAGFDADYPAAIGHLSRAEVIFDRIGDDANGAWTRFWIGRTIVARAVAGFAAPDETALATPYLRNALDYFEQQSQPVGVVFCALFEALNDLMLGHTATFQKAVEAATALGAAQPQGMALAMQSMTIPDRTMAMTLADRAIELLQGAGDGLNEAITTSIAACLEARPGQIPTRLRRSVVLHRRYGSPEWDAVILAGAAGILAMGGRKEVATQISGYLDHRLPSWRPSVRALGLPALELASRLPPSTNNGCSRQSILDLVERELRPDDLR